MREEEIRVRKRRVRNRIVGCVSVVVVGEAGGMDNMGCGDGLRAQSVRGLWYEPWLGGGDEADVVWRVVDM